ncbi:MAG: hypothetical protein HY814_14225 [Candidatus Riflebacteria bacterium]|nr:hypothetical protein [Candidatus Riflebacteria bacterium]
MKPVPGTAIEAFRRDRRQYESAKVLLDAINGTRRALEIGDYAESPQYGRWDVFSLAPHSMWPGPYVPTWGTFRNIMMPLMVANSSMHGGFVLPMSFDPDGGLWPALRFTFAVAPTVGEVVDWTVEMNTARRDGVFLATSMALAPAYSIVAADLSLNRTLRLPGFPPGIGPGDTVLVKVGRGSAALTVNPILVSVDFAFRRGAFGAKDAP